MWQQEIPMTCGCRTILSENLFHLRSIKDLICVYRLRLFATPARPNQTIVIGRYNPFVHLSLKRLFGIQLPKINWLIVVHLYCKCRLFHRQLDAKTLYQLLDVTAYSAFDGESRTLFYLLGVVSMSSRNARLADKHVGYHHLFRVEPEFGEVERLVPLLLTIPDQEMMDYGKESYFSSRHVVEGC